MHPILLNRDGTPLLLDAAKTGECVIGPERGFARAGIYVVFSESAKGGTVRVETAPDAGFAGAWDPITYVPWLAGYRTNYVSLVGPYLAVRIRITAPVIGGTVSVYGVAI